MKQKRCEMIYLYCASTRDILHFLFFFILFYFIRQKMSILAY